MVADHRHTRLARRRCLTAVGCAIVVAAANRTFAWPAVGDLLAQPHQPAALDGGPFEVASQRLIDRCGLKDAPWLNTRIDREFEFFRAGWSKTRTVYLAHANAMRDALRARQRLGFSCPVASQICVEARWLAQSTSDEKRILSRFADFDRAFQQERDMLNPAPVVQAADGSWAPHVAEPFLKLDLSIDYINRMVDAANSALPHCATTAAPTKLERPLSFLKHWTDADAMLRELSDRRQSAIHKTGRWNRQQFGSLLGNLSQLMLKKRVARWLREVARDDTFTNLHRARFIEFLDAAQDPCTGSWHDGYLFADGTSHNAYDLSNLYHVVQYRQDGIRRWDAIADGLIAVRAFQYPQGPLGDSREMDDHNGYDVFRVGMRCLDDAEPPISQANRIRLTQYLRQLAVDTVARLDRIFPRAKPPRQSYPAGVESAYFTVKLLDLIGFWNGRSRFLRADEMHNRQRLATAMLRSLQSYNDPAPMAQQSIALLKRYLGEC